MARTRSNWETARHAAWAKWGHKHSNWFVYGHLAARAAPWVALLAGLAALAWAVAWAWHHLPWGTLALLTGSGAVLVAVGWAGYELASVSAVRKGVTVQRLAMFGASGALAFAAVAAVMFR